jgi:hypothetical protein
MAVRAPPSLWGAGGFASTMEFRTFRFDADLMQPEMGTPSQAPHKGEESAPRRAQLIHIAVAGGRVERGGALEAALLGHA